MDESEEGFENLRLRGVHGEVTSDVWDIHGAVGEPDRSMAVEKLSWTCMSSMPEST